MRQDNMSEAIHQPRDISSGKYHHVLDFQLRYTGSKLRPINAPGKEQLYNSLHA